MKFLFLFFLFGIDISFAAERFENYNGVRALGMGGAGIAVVNDETTLLVNPAGLGRLRDFFMTIADPEVDASDNSAKIVGLDGLLAIDPQKTLDKFNDGQEDKYLYNRAQVFPSFVAPNFGIGAYGKYEVGANLDSVSNEFEYNYRNDFAMVFGFNFRIWDGRIKLGASSRVVNRVEIRETDIDPTRTDLTVSNLASEGLGVGTDVGLLLTAPWKALPTLAAVWRDAGNTRYTLKDGLLTSATTRPETTLSTIDLALSLSPILGKGTRGIFTIEYRDVQSALLEADEDKDDLMRKAHVGFELNYKDAAFLRLGMNQRYWTAGAELAVENYQLQLASYGEEVGTKETPKESRRSVLKFAYRF